ncbi:hypothetical protein [Paenibacillus piri]|uniref:DUF4015 domain-containing protein n=1 Tax=Paenibacillus piri TaxID=2547395 RepID=A0A4R5KED6_9BACL|nr:hypothetical protein [Paenibacillus piri]TDF92577.1 hypothetical protein E1757_29795 [Paenibacillus piri]
MLIKEVAASLYPWDLHDEGVDHCVDTLAEHANVNSVYLVGIMHKEKRPLRELYYPHNPKRKFYMPEDSCVYYRLDQADFTNTPLKPIYSSVDFLKETDWLDTLIASARSRKKKVGVEISHTIFDAKIARRDFPYLMQRKIDGTMLSLLCPNHDHVREYIRGLFHSSVKTHDVDFIQSCLILFAEGGKMGWHNHAVADEKELHVLLNTVDGGCFCEACRAKAIAMGYDWERIVSDLRQLNQIRSGAELTDAMGKKLLEQSSLPATALLLRVPSLYQWLEFRQKSITSLFRDIYEAVKSANPLAEFRYNTYLKYPELSGLDFAAIRPYIDSIRESDYSEMWGNPDQLAAKRQKILKIRSGIGYEKDVIAAIDVRPNVRGESNEDIIKQSVKLISNLGVDGLSLGHYDEATLSRLQAVKSAMEQSEMRLY